MEGIWIAGYFTGHLLFEDTLIKPFNDSLNLHFDYRLTSFLINYSINDNQRSDLLILKNNYTEAITNIGIDCL